MRTPRPAVHVPLATLLVLLACSDGAMSPGIVSPPEEARLAPRAAAAALSAAPGGVHFVETLVGVNPCTGEPELVTVSGTFWILHDDGQAVWRSESSITTSSGFQGRRTRTVVANENVFKVSLNGMLANASGQRYRVHFVLLVDLAGRTIRVMQGGGPVCLGA